MYRRRHRGRSRRGFSFQEDNIIHAGTVDFGGGVTCGLRGRECGGAVSEA